MVRSCVSCGSSFEILDEDLSFYDSVSPTFAGTKHPIPSPKLCPDCRFQRRLMFRNDRYLYHRKSSLSDRQIVSIYSPEKLFAVYDQDEWWNDRWNAMDYAMEIDFKKPFLEQLQELRLVVPRISLFTIGSENSYYTNHALFMKNCYLIFGGGNSEDCMFGNYVSFSKDVFDGLCLYSCERCYEGVASQRCYDCTFFTNCRDCTSCLMVEDCQSCSNCIECFGLYRKEYCIFNQPVGKEEFEKYRKELGNLTPRTIAQLRQRLGELKSTVPHRGSHIYGSENCTGDAIYNSKNCKHCFDVTDCEDSKYLAFTPKGINSYDGTFTSPDGLEFCYNVVSTVGTKYSMCTFLAWYGSSVYYSLECHSCHDIFGCVGLRNARYCILNREYTKDEYERALSKIVTAMEERGEWGEFFPPSMCPYGYNETNANDYFPLAKEEALTRGWKWREELEQQSYLGPQPEIPENITEVDEGICDRILICEVSGKPYKIIPQELEFYREMGLPIPRRCFDQRHRDRFSRRNPRKLWKRSCRKCGTELQTTYAPERPEAVYCESCYLKEVY
jgi:hypothetical protein